VVSLCSVVAMLCFKVFLAIFLQTKIALGVENASKCNLVQLLRMKMGSCDFRERCVDLSVSLSNVYLSLFHDYRNCNCHLHATEASRVRFTNKTVSLIPRSFQRGSDSRQEMNIGKREIWRDKKATARKPETACV